MLDEKRKLKERKKLLRGRKRVNQSLEEKYRSSKGMK